MNSIEQIILNRLLTDSKYLNKCIPHLKPEFFQDDRRDELIAEAIQVHYVKFHEAPSHQALMSHLDKKDRWIGSEEFQAAEEYVKFIVTLGDESQDAWLIDQTEDFVRTKRKYQSLIKGVKLLEGDPKQLVVIADEIRDAATFTLDPPAKQGRSLMDVDALFEHFQRPDKHFPFSVDVLNRHTHGGIMRQGLSIIVCPTNVGKTLFQCSETAHWLRRGFNVLFISTEDSIDTIHKRILANICHTPMEELETWPLDQLESIPAPPGKLCIRWFSQKSASTLDFEACLKDLAFKPDIVCVDYLGECRPKKKMGSNAVAYDTYGQIASELKAFAMVNDVAVLTSCQTNRQGYDKAPALDNTGLSYEINSGANLIIGAQKETVLVKDGKDTNMIAAVLKNKDRQMNPKQIQLSIDHYRMRLFDPNDFKSDYTAKKDSGAFKKPPPKAPPMPKTGTLEDMFGEELAS